MKSTLLLRQSIGDTKVSLVKIALDDGHEYYEVAEWNPREKHWVIVESNIGVDQPLVADQVYHEQCELAEKAERYRLR